MSKMPGNGSWADYLRRAMAHSHVSNAAELSRRSGISESQIGRWLRDIGVPDIDKLRKVSRTLQRPLLEMVVAAGHLSLEEAQMRDAPTVPDTPGARDAILADPSLSEASRAVLLAAYDAATSEDQGAHLIRRAGLGERTVRARATARESSATQRSRRRRRPGEAS
jgi:transcriptional regulator with XRE-family HTH domain